MEIPVTYFSVRHQHRASRNEDPELFAPSAVSSDGMSTKCLFGQSGLV